MPEKFRDWQVPDRLAPEKKKKGWIDEMIQESEGWMKGQSCYQDIPQNLALIAGRMPRNQERSELKTNYLKYCIRKIVSTLADIREIGTYASDNTAFQSQAEEQSRITKSIYHETHYSRKVRTALQYAMPTGCGYIRPVFRRTNYGFGPGEFEFDALGLLDVLPVQLPVNNDINGAYVVTIVEFLPIAEAHGRYQLWQDKLLPVSKGKYNTSVGLRRLDMAELFRYGMESKNWSDLYVEIDWTFIRDVKVNTTGDTIMMGQPGTSWYYEVPTLGSEIQMPGGKMRRAEPEDSMIYPQMRLMLSSPSMEVPMYDNTAFDWSNIIPAVKYSVDDWPWEPLSYSLVGEISSIDIAKQQIERGMHQVASHRLDPSLAYDLSSGMGGPEMEKMDPWEHRLRTGTNGKPRDVVDTLLPEWIQQIPDWEFKFHDLLTKLMEQQLGLNDIGNLANLKMNIQSDDAAKMLSEIGPLAKDIESGIEMSNGRVAKILQFMVPQYMTNRRKMEYLGADKVSLETFDYDPDSLIPSHTPEEIANAPDDVAMLGPSSYSKVQRGKRFAQNLRLIGMKGSNQQITGLQEQLKYLQLWRDQKFPIAPHDVAKKLEIENFGEIEGATVFERWVNWKKKEIELTAQAQQLAGTIMPQQQEPPSGGGKGKTGNPKGRPPSGEAAPKIAQKGGAGGAPRTVVKESK